MCLARRFGIVKRPMLCKWPSQTTRSHHINFDLVHGIYSIISTRIHILHIMSPCIISYHIISQGWSCANKWSNTMIPRHRAAILQLDLLKGHVGSCQAEWVPGFRNHEVKTNHHMGVSKKNGKTPQIIHLFIGLEPLFSPCILGSFPLFLETPISIPTTVKCPISTW